MSFRARSEDHSTSRCFRLNSVHLGWCSYAAVWLSRIPTLIPGHFLALRSTGAERAAFERQGAEDWEAFLSLRAGELRPGGRSWLCSPALMMTDYRGLRVSWIMRTLYSRKWSMKERCTAEERDRMVLGTYPRRKSDLLAPFRHDGQFQRPDRGRLRASRCFRIPHGPTTSGTAIRKAGDEASTVLPVDFCSVAGG